jgi:hypothetical protein
MLYKLKLKNSDKMAVVDGETYDYIQNNEYLNQVGFLKHLRIHSSGYAFFQKNWLNKDGSYRNETIYLHKLVAEKFVEKPKIEKRLFVILKNGDRLDCRVKNLEWTTFSHVTRNTRKTDNPLGYRGIVKDNQKYRAVIYKEGKRFNLGLYDTPEEAALAYNKKSIELFGKTRSLNVIDEKKQKEIEAKQKQQKAS